MTFQKAERKKVPLKLALTGPSGSGKTFSALLLASGIGKKIAIIDTENGSASLYAGMKTGPLVGIDFDVLDLEPPYTITKYAEGIKAAEDAGYDVLIIDSISHAWAGEGGLLSKKEALDARGGRQNQYTNWAPITKEHELFKSRLLNSKIDLICTMRSKQDYVLENKDGKQTPRKVGMAPIQREGMEYEFAVVFDIAMDHSAAASKDRTAMFDGMIAQLTRETGRQMSAWRAEAKDLPKPAPQTAAKPASKPQGEDASDYPEPAAPPVDPNTPITDKQQIRIADGVKIITGLGFTPDQIWQGIYKEVQAKLGVTFAETSEISSATAEVIIDYLTRWFKHITSSKAKAAAKPAAAGAEA